MEMTESGLEENLKRFYLLNFLDGLWVLYPIYILFMLDYGMSLTAIGIVLGAQSLVQFLFEIPSSIWADKFSRRNIMIWNGVFILFSDAMFLYFHSFPFFLLACCLAGLGNAFYSGTFSAIIYDTLLNLGREKDYECVQSRVNKGYFLGGAIASLFGAYLYAHSHTALLVLTSLVHISYIVVACTLHEPGRVKSESRSFAQMREGVAFLRKEKLVWYLLIVFSLTAATADFSFVYYQPVLRSMRVPVENYGVIYVIVNLLNYWGAGAYLKLKNKSDWRSLMFIFMLINFFAALLLGSGMLVPALLAVAFISLSFGAQNIYVGNIIHRSVPSSHRATALSIQAQMGKVFYLVLIAGLGYVVDRSSIAFGLGLNALIVLVALVFFWQLSRGRKYICADGEMVANEAG
jgi:predicted MFS family arabinose efflux permease